MNLPKFCAGGQKITGKTSSTRQRRQEINMQMKYTLLIQWLRNQYNYAWSRLPCTGRPLCYHSRTSFWILWISAYAISPQREYCLTKHAYFKCYLLMLPRQRVETASDLINIMKTPHQVTRLFQLIGFANHRLICVSD